MINLGKRVKLTHASTWVNNGVCKPAETGVLYALAVGGRCILILDAQPGDARDKIRYLKTSLVKSIAPWPSHSGKLKIETTYSIYQLEYI